MANLSVGTTSPSNVSFTVGKPAQASTFAASAGTTSRGGSLSIQSATSQNYSGYTPSAITASGGASQLSVPGTSIGTQTVTKNELSFDSPTTDQVNNALGNSTSATKSDSGGSSGGGQREIDCPFCNGQMLTKKAGRTFLRIAGLLQRSFSIKLPSSLVSFLQENTPVGKIDILKGNCEVCKNKRKIKDPTDDSSKWSAATSNFQGKAEEIQKNEAKLASPGGNRYTIIQGSDLLEVGLGMNDVPSYRVDKEAMVRNARMTDLGNKETDPKKGGPIPKGARMNHIQGTNPPASPGGHYIIKCSNKFSLITGAQGIDITTGGPITINGGITQITGPEVTIGTQTGRLALEGEAVNIGGKSIEMAPTDGQVFVKGTLGTSGNIVCGGHAHMESASVVNLETTGKNQESNISSANNVYGGPAFWGGSNTEGLQAALKELKSYVLFNTTNPEHAKYLPSTRFTLGLGDNLQNISYIMRPIELVQTGICICGDSIGIVYNFPHIHAIPDQAHTHETRVPDIKCDADDAGSLRGAQGGAAGPAPLHKTQKNLVSTLQDFWSAISVIFVGIASSLQHNTYRK